MGHEPDAGMPRALHLRRGGIRRMLQIAAAALALATLGAAFSAGTAAAAKTDVLVVADSIENYQGPVLTSGLRSIGYTVAESTSVPPSLSSYKSVWTTRVNESFSPSEEEALESYVKAGGRLYLTGEHPLCCEAINQSDQRIARALLKDQEVQVGGGEEFRELTGGQYNPEAKDGVTQGPHELKEFLGDAPGAITGVDELGAGHALAFKEGRPVGAVFDEADMQNGLGRLIIYMDVNYLDPNNTQQAERLELIENLEDFLRNTPARRRLPNGGAGPGNVLVITSESSTNLQAGFDTAAVLRSLHYRVTLNVAPTLPKAEARTSGSSGTVASWTMPKLKQYAAVWMLAENSRALQGANRELIESYVAAGGSLYLGGNDLGWPSDATDEDVLRHVLSSERVTVHDSINQGTMQFAAGALDGITQGPSRLSEIPIHYAGEISGLEPRNVLAKAGDAVTAAAFDEADMRSRRGRLVDYPDDWTQTEPDAISREAFVQNIQDFMEATPERIAPRATQYVGLGDSYASGQGSGEYEAGTGGEGGCFHAVHGYIAGIGRDDHMTTANEACSGAQVYELWEPGEHESQLAAVGPDTTAVTLSVGGDDMGFAGVIKSCLLPHGNIPGTHIPRLLFSEGCKKGLEGPSQEAMSWLRNGRKAGNYTRPGGDHARNANYQPSLQQLYETILYQAPGAELVVIGYPHLMESAVAAGEAVECEVEPFTPTSYGLKVKASDIPWINQVTDEVDQLIGEAVKVTHEETHRQIRFADPRSLFYSHGLCDKSASYINPLVFEPEFKIAHWKLDITKLLLNRQPESFHPSVKGQEAFRYLIEQTAEEF